MIDAALDVLHEGSGWLLIAASVAVVAAIRHLRHLHRLRAAAALHDPHGAPLDPFAVADDAARRGWQNYGTWTGTWSDDAPTLYDWSDDDDLA